MLKELHATAWSLDDVKKNDPTVELAVVMLPPKTRSKTYERAVHVIEGLDARAVAEDDVEEWAIAAVQKVLPQSGVRGQKEASAV